MTLLIAPPIARPRETRPATTAARRVILAGSAPHRKPKSPATVAVRLAISAVSAPRTQGLPEACPLVVADKNATSAANGVTLPATAPRVEEVMVVAATEVATVEEQEDMAAERVRLPATPAVVLAT